MFHYSLSITPDNVERYVSSITFDIGRYGSLTKTLIFDRFLTEREAIHAAEAWLNQPMTMDHLQKLKEEGDLFCGGEDVTIEELNYNWKALGDCSFLERIDRQNHEITLFCGS